MFQLHQKCCLFYSWQLRKRHHFWCSWNKFSVLLILTGLNGPTQKRCQFDVRVQIICFRPTFCYTLVLQIPLFCIMSNKNQLELITYENWKVLATHCNYPERTKLFSSLWIILQNQIILSSEKWYFFTKIVLSYCEKKLF